jgi:prepilin-type N-terminal cleavage/methylation domain-containing protein
VKSTTCRRLPCPGSLARAGFSLIELLAAITLFGVLVVGFVSIRWHAVTQARDANRDRILRFLAGHQIGYLRLGVDESRNEFDTDAPSGDFSLLADELGEEAYASFVWSAEVVEVVVAGTSEDDDVVPLFEDEDLDDEDEEESDAKPVILRRITLKVRHRDDEDENAGLTVVTFAPRIEEEAAEGDG